MAVRGASATLAALAVLVLTAHISISAAGGRGRAACYAVPLRGNRTARVCPCTTVRTACATFYDSGGDELGHLGLGNLTFGSRRERRAILEFFEEASVTDLYTENASGVFVTYRYSGRGATFTITYAFLRDRINPRVKVSGSTLGGYASGQDRGSGEFYTPVDRRGKIWISGRWRSTPPTFRAEIVVHLPPVHGPQPAFAGDGASEVEGHRGGTRWSQHEREALPM